MIFKLLKFLHGMKRAPKLWHEKFDITFTYASFIMKNEANKYVHYHYSVGEGVILCLYVDDRLIFGTSLNMVKELKDLLSNNFGMKDFELVMLLLSINIKLLRDQLRYS